jgi:hypothetical protein
MVAAPGGNRVVFNRHHSSEGGEHQSDHSVLVEMLLGADETERKRILLEALQSGEVRKSEVAELLRLVDRLEALSGTKPHAEPDLFR